LENLSTPGLHIKMEAAEQLVDRFMYVGKHYVKPVGRLALLSTFCEDGFRMFYQWGDQTAYIKSAWSCGNFLAYMFVIFNLVFQLVPCIAIVFKRDNTKITQAGVFMLLSVMVVQTMAYTVLWSWDFFLRNIAVAGSLVLLYTETVMEKKNSRTGGGMLESGAMKSEDYLLGVARVMVSIMFLTMMKFDSAFRIVVEILCLGLIVAVMAGFKGKLSSMTLCFLLLMQNFIFNFYWSEHSESAVYDFKKYDFYQTLSVIGGLLLLVAYGPGGFSLDERKRDE